MMSHLLSPPTLNTQLLTLRDQSPSWQSGPQPTPTDSDIPLTDSPQIPPAVGVALDTQDFPTISDTSLLDATPSSAHLSHSLHLTGTSYAKCKLSHFSCPCSISSSMHLYTNKITITCDEISAQTLPRLGDPI